MQGPAEFDEFENFGRFNLRGLIGRKVDKWDFISAIFIVLSASSLIFPDVDDGLAILGAISIYLMNRVFHYGDGGLASLPSEAYELEFAKEINEVMNNLTSTYGSILREKLEVNGYASELIESVIEKKSKDLARTVSNAINTGINRTVINIMESSLSENRSFFVSPYTGKKYAFIFGTTEDLLTQFARDDFQQILKDSMAAIHDLLKSDSAA